MNTRDNDPRDSAPADSAPADDARDGATTADDVSDNNLVGGAVHDERLSDPAYERLSAGDPAVAAEPDLAVIKAKVDASTATILASAPAQGATAGTAPATPAPVVDLAAQRAARRPARWLQVAAAAVGVVAVGGGAFIAGQHVSSSPISAEAPSANSGLVSGPAGPSAPEGPSGAGGFAAGAPGEGANKASADSASSMVGPGSGGRTVFTSSGLSDAAGSGQAWGYDAASTFSAETAARLAAALGVSGDPSLNYGSWHVGSLDWTAAALDLSSDGTTSFYFSDPAFNPWVENSSTTGATPEAATAALTDVMTALGVDPAGFTITVDSTQDPHITSVSATSVQAAGTSAGTWSAAVTTDGLYSLNGSLAPLVDLGTYAVVSPQAAVERLGDERFGATQDFSAFDEGAVPATRDMVSVLPDDPTAIPTLPGTPAPGAAFAWPVANVTITAATLGTSTYYQPDGSVTLLPTYTLTGSDGSSWTVLAVADAHLDFAATS